MRTATTTCEEEEEEEGAAFGGRVEGHCSCVSSDSMRVQCECVESEGVMSGVGVVVVVVARCVGAGCEPDGRPQQPMPVSKKRGKGEERGKARRPRRRRVKRREGMERKQMKNGGVELANEEKSEGTRRDEWRGAERPQIGACARRCARV